jgi:hypothetical protein
MVEEKVNVVVVSAMSQISNHPSDVTAFLLTTEALSIISTQKNFDQILTTSCLVRNLHHIKKGISEWLYA